MRTSRHNIEFNRIPKRYDLRAVRQQAQSITDYAAILDSTYEMADMVATSNSLSLESALNQVLKDEKFTVLKADQHTILKMLGA